MNKDKVDYPMHVNTWKETGKPMSVYCKEKEISYQTFMYHASRMKEKDASKAFTRIDLPNKTTLGIEYHYANGNYFVFPSGCSVQIIKALIS